MGIISKDVQTYLWVFLEFSMRLCCTFVREHPLPSLVFLIFIVLYVFLSTIFWFLIYTLPLLLIAGVIIKVIYFPECPKDVGAENRENGDPKSPRKIKFAEDEEKKKKAIGRAQSVRRRKSKKDFPPYLEEDGGSIFPPTGFGEHDMVDKSALTEENMKDIREVEVHSVSDRAECSSSDASQSVGGICVEGFAKDWLKSFRSRDESEAEMTDSSENEGARRDRNRGVQWTQEDQKNLMDLSEMERNKRLESMIARRRARRLVSLHVRRTLMNIGSDDPPMSIVIPRTNSGSSGPFSPTPGSAPSVLLPNHNPFDLPYDQHEEKPNLRGGSFHQDFMVPHQDLVFCRHESFSLGPSFSEDFNSDFPHRYKVFEVPESYRSRTPFGKEDAADRVIEQVSVEEPEELNRDSTSDVKEQASADREEDGSEVQIKSVLIEDIDDRTSSSSSSEEDEPFYRIDKDAILKSLTTPSAPRNITVDSQENLNPGPSMSQKARMEEHFYYANGAMLPTPSHSVASDLQVEVSEVGSPPRSVDGTSSLEEEISVYNREMEKDTTSANECTWVASSRSSRLDENESRSREVREVTEQDLVKSGFSNINPTLHIPPERVIQQDSVDSNSFADTQAYKSGESSASIEENDILELVKRNSHAKHGAELAISEASESHADLEASFPPEPVFEQAHVASFPSLSSMTVSQSEFLTDQEGSSNLDQEARVGVQDVNGHKVENDTSNLLLNDQIAQHSFPPSEADKNGENSMSIEKNDVREVTQDRAVEPPSKRGFSAANQSGHGHQTTLLIPESVDEQVPDMSSSSTSPKSQSMFSMNQDSSSNFVSKIHSEDQQYGFAGWRSEDLGSSMVNQSSNDPESVVGQISTSSSSSSSPNSISQTKLSWDLGSSNSDQETQMEVPQFQNQIAETLTHQATDDISYPTTSHESGQLLADIPTVHQQESSNDHKKSSDEASSDNHVNASMIQEREILNTDSVKETEGLPKLETTARRSESYDHDKSSEETSANNHINPSVIHEDTQNKDSITEAEGLPKLETSAHHSESHDLEKYSEETSTSNHTNALVIPEEKLRIDSTEETERLPKLEMTTNHLESNDHKNSSEETSSDNHTNASVIQEKEIQNTDSIKETEGPPKLEMTEGGLLHLDAERGPQGPSMAENKGAKMTEGAAHLEGTVQKPVAEVKSDVNNVVESESRTFTVNEVSNFNVSKAVQEKSDSTHSANSIEREATPDLSEKPVENEREIPNLNIVDKENDKAPSFQGSHEGESRGLASPDSVNKPSQISQSVHPSKVQDPEGEHRIQNEVDTAISTSRGAGKDHDSKDSEKSMNSENAADHLKANEANIGSGERDHSNTNLKD